MGKLSEGIGFVAGAKLGSSSPKTLFTITAILEVVSLVLALSGSALGGILSCVAGIFMIALGVRCGGSLVACVVFAFFQLLFIIGIIQSGPSYLIAHLLCIVYPFYKAVR